MSDLNEENLLSQRTNEAEGGTNEEIMLTLQRLLGIQKDVRRLLHGLRETVDSLVLRDTEQEGRRAGVDIQEEDSSLEEDEYRTGLVEPPKTDPAKSQWRDLAASFNAAAKLVEHSEGKPQTRKITSWYIKKASVSFGEKKHSEQAQNSYEFALPLELTDKNLFPICNDHSTPEEVLKRAIRRLRKRNQGKNEVQEGVCHISEQH